MEYSDPCARGDRSLEETLRWELVSKRKFEIRIVCVSCSVRCDGEAAERVASAAWILLLDPVSGSHLFGIICCMSSAGVRMIRMIPGDDLQTVSEFSALLGSMMDTRSCISSRGFGGFYTFSAYSWTSASEVENSS